MELQCNVNSEMLTFRILSIRSCVVSRFDHWVISHGFAKPNSRWSASFHLNSRVGRLVAHANFLFLHTITAEATNWKERREEIIVRLLAFTALLVNVGLFFEWVSQRKCICNCICTLPNCTTPVWSGKLYNRSANPSTHFHLWAHCANSFWLTWMNNPTQKIFLPQRFSPNYCLSSMMSPTDQRRHVKERRRISNDDSFSLWFSHHNQKLRRRRSLFSGQTDYSDVWNGASEKKKVLFIVNWIFLAGGKKEWMDDSSLRAVECLFTASTLERNKRKNGSHSSIFLWKAHFSWCIISTSIYARENRYEPEMSAHTSIQDKDRKYFSAVMTLASTSPLFLFLLSNPLSFNVSICAFTPPLKYYTL